MLPLGSWGLMGASLDKSSLEQVRGELKAKLPPHVYQSLVEPAEMRRMNSDTVLVRFEDEFSREQFERKCLPTFREALQGNQRLEPHILLEVSAPSPAPPTNGQLELDLSYRSPFDSRYTFDTFVIGSSNQFAHAACLAVSRQPGQCYNPLFIFGGAGLGKTHLLRAIGFELYRTAHERRIQFLTCEAFTNELIQAIRVDRMREFREKFRSGCDVLLLDDIHFLVGKDRTQEEFFYTFNYLHECRKQIVITSDRYPKDIQGLESRLQSRFEWGLVADVQPPEIETRIAILKNKADSEHIHLSDSVAEYIASHFTTNIRTLEGSLHRLQAHAALSGVPINLELAKQIFKDESTKAKHEITAEGILKLVALQFNLTTAELKSDKRIRKLSLPRQICMYLLRKHKLMSYPAIGKFMGGKDHTTILHGVAHVAELLKTDPEIQSYTTSIENLLK